ncbi:MAG: HAD family phosphatase [Proteobacteria bacterium]|nr:HAD family phosphatase [Pseudomonadota bacterium]
MSRTVIFDVGGVLIHWDIRLVYRAMLPDEAAIDAFLAETGWHDWNRDLDRGGRWDDAVEALSARFPHHRALIEASHHRWHDAVPGAIEGTVEILDALHHAPTPLVAITNFSAEKWRETQDRFPFLKTHFRDVVVSGEEHLVKPDPAIFRLCLERNGLEPRDCIFIDDLPHNIAAAGALGIDGILFTGADALRRDLGQRGFAL